jgi:hypothetical protein
MSKCSSSLIDHAGGIVIGSLNYTTIYSCSDFGHVKMSKHMGHIGLFVFPSFKNCLKSTNKKKDKWEKIAKS